MICRPQTKGPAAVLCNRCGTENPEGTIVCIQCYYAVGAPYQAAAVKGSKKSAGKTPAWATDIGLNDVQYRQVSSQLGDLIKGPVTAYWFATQEDAAETQKALADTVGAEIKAKKVKIATAAIEGRTALFIAGKIADPQMLQMVCESFNGRMAF